MAIVLITGMSATGKSTVLAELALRSALVVDTDDPGWTLDVTDETGRPDRRWHPRRMADLLNSHDNDRHLFISGCVSNQGDFYDRFDAVVLLTCPVAVMLHRLAERNTNSFGKSDEERRMVLDDLASVEPLLKRRATIEIDTRASVTDVADSIARVAEASRRPAS